MRKKYTLTLDDKKLNVINVIYYDGAKLQVGENKNIVLAWYDNYADYEEWFYIELEKNLYKDYISNNISLLKILEEGDVKLVKREFSNYTNLVVISNDVEFSKFELPDDDSYLGFNFYEEYFENKLNYKNVKTVPSKEIDSKSKLSSKSIDYHAMIPSNITRKYTWVHDAA